MKKKLIQFGAGNIGRSFIAQLFSRGGYEVVFVDVDEQIIKALNNENHYRLIIKKNDLPDETIWIENVRAVNAADKNIVANEICDASLIATSVGKNALPHIFPVIALGLEKRLQNHGQLPADIIIAENIHEGAKFFLDGLSALLPTDYEIDKLLGLVETSIGKMVPIMTVADRAIDPAWVFAESYNTLILDKYGFKGGIPEVEGIYPVENINAYVDRKLFIHNLGHAASAYLGYRYNPEFTYIYQALEVTQIYEEVKKCMRQSAKALNMEYPVALPADKLEEHIENLLYRFQNKSLGDTIFRVGRDLYRKLDKEDRVVGAILLAAKNKCSYDAIKDVFHAACNFRGLDEKGNLFPAEKKFAEDEFPGSIANILMNVCRLSYRDSLEASVIKVLTAK